MEGNVIAVPASEVEKEVKRREALRQKQAELLYQKQMEAIKHGELKKNPQNSQTVKSVTINLELPKFDKATTKIKTKAKKVRNRIKRRDIFITAGVFSLATIIYFGFNFIVSKNNNTDPTQVAGTSTVKRADFTPLVPVDKGVPKSTVKPQDCSTDTDGLICYQDIYLNGQMFVTQQEFPLNQQISPQELMNMARTSSISNTVSFKDIQTNYGNAVIIRDSKSKIQSAVYVFQNRLVSIRADKQYTDLEWKVYLNSLKVASN